ncbi:peptidase S8/S53 domain-containing protein [Xylogone sp. PMI_703]|nr:peptidase S8/S53 domain-containing protein [Xylogone sp. PMI_703]
MVLLNFATLALLSAAFVGAAPSTEHVTHERRDVYSNHHWEKRSRLEPHDVIPVRIGLTQRNLDQGHDLLMDVSDPDSGNYGKHWTVEQIIERFSPTQESIEAIREWLIGSGIAENRIIHSIGYEWIHFNATIQEAEELFQTEYHLFEHGLELRNTVGCDEYKVPSHLARHIDFVHPGVALVGSMAKKVMRRSIQPEEQLATRKVLDERAAAGPCDDLNFITPACIQYIYGVPKGDKKAPGNSLGLFEHGSWYSPISLATLLANFTDIPPETRPINITIDISQTHYNDNFSFDGEASLDIQMALPLVYPQNITIYQVDDDYYAVYAASLETYLGLFQSWLNAIDKSYCNYTAFGETGNDPNIDPTYPDNNPDPANPSNPNMLPAGWYRGPPECGTVKSTNVYSLSYGWEEQQLPYNYMHRQCNEFMKLSLMGTTIVVASGDSGSAVGSACGFGDPYLATAQYPANCPYLLTVGATQLLPGLTEVGANIGGFASSGGFSWNYSRPAYQDEAVQTYLNNHESLDRNRFNSNGRGFPDVSAVGWKLLDFYGPNATMEAAAGTSGSAPIFAAVINRINEERLAVGKSRVGFVNPVLYKNPQMFNDVTEGNNSLCTSVAFTAAVGWDPVTGLGTPNYPKMLDVFMKLP